MRSSAPIPLGKAWANSVLPSMIPVLPEEVSSPGPRRSMSATASPRWARCSAVDMPTMPAPSTIASVRAMVVLLFGDGRLQRGRFGYLSDAIDARQRGCYAASMGLLDRPAAALVSALTWLGRQGTRAVAVSIVLGIFLPPLGAIVRPYFSETVYALLVLAFLRVDPGALRAQLAK